MALAVVIGLCLPASAAAHVSVVDMPQRTTDPRRHTIILEAPDDAWGMRAVAQRFDERVEGLVIRTDRGITCDVTVSCIRVHIGHFDQDCGDLGHRWWRATSSVTPSDSTTTSTAGASARGFWSCPPATR